jgi:hypothetical protein
MSRWFDCPDCIGYCKEWICPCCGLSRCEMCGKEVVFETAPEELHEQMYKAGLWCEEIAVVLDQDGDRQIAPAFTCQEVYDKYIQWNAVRMGAACDQLTALLCDDTDEDTDDGDRV